MVNGHAVVLLCCTFLVFKPIQTLIWWKYREQLGSLGSNRKQPTLPVSHIHSLRNNNKVKWLKETKNVVKRNHQILDILRSSRYCLLCFFTLCLSSMHLLPLSLRVINRLLRLCFLTDGDTEDTHCSHTSLCCGCSRCNTLVQAAIHTHTAREAGCNAQKQQGCGERPRKLELEEGLRSGGA